MYEWDKHDHCRLFDHLTKCFDGPISDNRCPVLEKNICMCEQKLLCVFMVFNEIILAGTVDTNLQKLSKVYYGTICKKFISTTKN